MKPPFVNGPGKALRQDQYTHTSSIGGGGGLLSTRASVSSEQSPSSSMSTSQQQQQQQQHQVNSTSTAAVAAAAAAAPRISSAVVSLQNVKSGASGSSSKLDITSSVLLHTEAVASGGPNGPGATAASGGGGGATSRFATTTGVAASFISTMDKEEMARCEKFEKILANNPVNLGNPKWNLYFASLSFSLLTRFNVTFRVSCTNCRRIAKSQLEGNSAIVSAHLLEAALSKLSSIVTTTIIKYTITVC